MVKHLSKELLPLVVFLCLPLLVSAKYYLPTIFWHQDNPALDRRYWSKVVNVQTFQQISFLCPTNYVDIVPSTDANNKIKSYYNLYVRDVPADEPNPDYTTFCDRTKSRYIFSCNRTRDTPPDFTKEGSHKSFEINTHQAHESIPTFTRGKQYIFFSTSNGQRASLDSPSTNCTMVFRIYFCNTSEPCPKSLCSTFGREDVCHPKLKPTPEPRSATPSDVQVVANTTSSLTISWKEPMSQINVSYYSICYRMTTSSDCLTKIVEPHVRSSTLENLNASTVYRIRVRAHTCKGPGNYSKEISQKIRDVIKVPTTTVRSEVTTSKPEDTIPSKPRAVSTSSTGSSITVSWKEPAIGNEEIIFYRICCRELNNTENCSFTKLSEPQARTAVLTGLKYSTKYGIRVRAYTCKGPGDNSEEVERDTLEAEPSTAAQSSCSGATVDAVSLVIGLVIGFIAALAIAVVVWLFTAKRRKSDEKPVLSNITNKGYRASVSGMDSIKSNGKASNYDVELSRVK